MSQTHSGSISKISGSGQLNLNTATGTTDEWNYSGFSSGTVAIPTGSSITTLTYHAAPESGGTYLPLQTAAGSAVTQTVAATKVYDLPASVAGCRFLKIVVNAAGAVSWTAKG